MTPGWVARRDKSNVVRCWRTPDIWRGMGRQQLERELTDPLGVPFDYGEHTPFSGRYSLARAIFVDFLSQEWVRCGYKPVALFAREALASSPPDAEWAYSEKELRVWLARQK